MTISFLYQWLGEEDASSLLSNVGAAKQRLNDIQSLPELDISEQVEGLTAKLLEVSSRFIAEKQSWMLCILRLQQ